jgi:Leucine-rich repeat (LRR) protein
LNLASNQIKSIGSLFFLSSVIHRIDYPFLGTSLAENTELEVLNLADNTISSFQVKLSLKKDIHTSIS